MADNSSKKSPMSELFNELDAGLDSSTGILARLWRIMLKRLNIEPHMWERLLNKWVENNTEIYGRAGANTKKGNAVRSLVKRTLTWKNFMDAISIICSTGKYKMVRFEVHLVPAVEGDTEVVGINVWHKPQENSKHLHGDPSVNFNEAEILKPGDIAHPDKLYLLQNFKNNKFNGVVIKNVSGGDIKVSEDYFHGASAIGQLLLDEDGVIDDHWRLYTPLKAD